jgi:hypothetical protein
VRCARGHAAATMMALLGLWRRYQAQEDTDAGDGPSFWTAEMPLDQVIQFFETDWEGRGGMRWLVDADTVRVRVLQYWQYHLRLPTLMFFGDP